MHTLAIVAGNNDPSNCNYLANTFIEELKKNDVTVEKIRLKDMNLEHFSLKHYESDYEHEKNFKKIQSGMECATGVVIATPIWNFGVPANLKNLIDRMGSFALDESRSKGTLNYKPFYFIFTGGAPLPAWKGLMKKTTSFVQEGLRYFGASITGTFFEGECMLGRGKFGLVVDKRPERLNSLRKEATKFAKIVRTYEKTGKAPIANRSKNSLMKIGETVLKKITGN